MFTTTRPGLLLSVVLLLLIANTSLSAKVKLPKIDVYNTQLTTQEDGYSLRIIMPNGTSRDEVVALINPGTPEQYLAVKATSVQIYPGAANKKSYTAAEMDYINKYKAILDELASKKMPELGALALKSTAG